MDWGHQLNEAEIAEALLGKRADERLASCEVSAAEFAAWAELGERLRNELGERADLPAYFWTRQQARIRERLASRRTTLRWAAAAVVALLLLAFAVATRGPALSPELAQTSQSNAAQQQVDADNALLEDIQASLEREVPGPLLPATVLVQEMADSRQSQQVKEN